MTPFTTHTGICAPLIEDNIDTDQIIPSREMTRVSKQGLGAGLFAGWRFLYDGREKIGLDKDFVLNRPEYENASILLSGRNFGWAAQDASRPASRTTVETRVYDLPADALVWSGGSRPMDPSSTDSFMTLLVRTVGDELQRAGLLGP